MEVDQKPEFTISEKAPIVLIVLGMAGSGKTTFVHVSLFKVHLTNDLLEIDLLSQPTRKEVLQH